MVGGVSVKQGIPDQAEPKWVEKIVKTGRLIKKELCGAGGVT